METLSRGSAPAPDLSSPLMTASVARAARDYGWRPTGLADDGATMLRVNGEWSDYDLALRLLNDGESIEIRCFFALAPPDERWYEIGKLADSLNRRFHRGQLDLHRDSDHGTYTDWVPMKAVDEPGGLDLIGAMRAAVGTCDFLLFPAFHCVAWAEIDAEAALDRLNYGTTSYRFH